MSNKFLIVNYKKTNDPKKISENLLTSLKEYVNGHKAHEKGPYHQSSGKTKLNQ